MKGLPHAHSLLSILFKLIVPFINLSCLIAQLFKSCLRDTFTGANLGSNPIGRITFTRLSMEKNVSEPKKIEYNMKFGHILS